MEIVLLGIVSGLVIAVAVIGTVVKRNCEKIGEDLNHLDNLDIANDMKNDRFLSMELRFDKLEHELDNRIKSTNQDSINRDNKTLETIASIEKETVRLDRIQKNNSTKGY